MISLVGAEDPVLRAEAVRVKDPTSPDTIKLAEQMLMLVRELDGFAIAAPQVGVSARIIVCANGIMVANPELSFLEDIGDSVESCLSLPGLAYHVERAHSLHVHGSLIGNGTPIEIDANGLYARVYQHEVDHLDGVLISDLGLPIVRSA